MNDEKDNKIQVGELWRAYHSAQQLRRQKRLEERKDELLALSKDGFEIKQLTETRFRVNKAIDIWLVHNTYMDLLSKHKGQFKGSVAEFVKKWFAT